MRGTIAPADAGWYEALLAEGPLEEVNFWTPSARRAVRAEPFSPFFFKLRAPHSAICGFGYFARYARLPDWLAWESFGRANGCATFEQLRARIGVIRARIGYDATTGSDEIGCVLVVRPVFFRRESWVRQPSDWPVRTLTPTGYDLTRGEGKRVLEECLQRGTGRPEVADRFDTPRFGKPTLVLPRLGQGTFRIAVTEAYGRACAITGEHSLAALQAAHIRPYADEGPHAVANGLLLRADLHRLFDLGYVTLRDDLTLHVGERLRRDWNNGRTYYPLEGMPVRVPRTPNERPAAEFVRWHRERLFRG